MTLPNNTASHWFIIALSRSAARQGGRGDTCSEGFALATNAETHVSTGLDRNLDAKSPGRPPRQAQFHKTLSTAQKQDQSHDVLALLCQVGVDGDRGRVPSVVQHDISGRGSTLNLGPAAPKTGFDFVENLSMRGIALLCGLEPLRIASVGRRSIERAVPPAGQG